MPKMQVTFTNVALGAQQVQPADSRHISLMFQIEFRGKSYNCVGHLKQFPEGSRHENRVHFTGYYGYNGPIDIESLRSAVVDYYQSAISTQETMTRRVKIDLGEHESISAEEPGLPATRPTQEVCKSYEFNVGKFRYGEWKQAS